MNLLIDTHILLWALADDPKLSEKARNIISDRENHIYYSAVSLWEIELKHIIHPEQLIIDSKSIYEYCCMSDYQQLFLKSDAVFLLPSLHRPVTAPAHKDPYDKILLCQAKAENMQFVTHDEKLVDYNVENVILV